MQKTVYPFCGTFILEEDVPNYQVSYRWHLTNPVRFNKKIKVILESGHANDLRVPGTLAPNGSLPYSLEESHVLPVPLIIVAQL
ncbi:hypothetical protein AtubIFM55763_008472 [Aspergillus tubingensis]|uniref:Uncharacterized protein n=1 Tax=Aspergillus tubingensis TaxID=5068 RepID=A0A9W6ASB1_ASPTU|nr:hypothetical protein AtubIFM54640_006154 [Aspergillus tubingensis]GLA76600.1 hypothetical protein AtubIFM55763_008472 [Aspergillus tubingensis]GLA86122.1 hypothetical protein AtubIFM56815_010373 [Aspergillus tubingensis]GLB01070.1 hypothetical protein AtubIFM57143_010447 [Aspergillus tubingensis]